MTVRPIVELVKRIYIKPIYKAYIYIYIQILIYLSRVSAIKSTEKK